MAPQVPGTSSGLTTKDGPQAMSSRQFGQAALRPSQVTGPEPTSFIPATGEGAQLLQDLKSMYVGNPEDAINKNLPWLRRTQIGGTSGPSLPITVPGPRAMGALDAIGAAAMIPAAKAFTGAYGGVRGFFSRAGKWLDDLPGDKFSAADLLKNIENAQLPLPNTHPKVVAATKAADEAQIAWDKTVARLGAKGKDTRSWDIGVQNELREAKTGLNKAKEELSRLLTGSGKGGGGSDAALKSEELDWLGLEDWLQQRADETDILWHGTTTDNVDNIMKRGLDPSKADISNIEDEIFNSSEADIARDGATFTYMSHYPGTARERGGAGEVPVLLRVTLPPAEAKKLVLSRGEFVRSKYTIDPKYIKIDKNTDKDLWDRVIDRREARKSVTKQEVQDFINQHQVKMEEVVLSSKKFKDVGIDRDETTGKWYTTGQEYDPPNKAIDGKFFDTEDEAGEYARQVSASKRGLGAHYANEPDYKTPGGRNYREVLFKYPQPSNRVSSFKELSDRGYKLESLGNNRYRLVASDGRSVNPDWGMENSSDDSFLNLNFGNETPEQQAVKMFNMIPEKAGGARGYRAGHFDDQGDDLLAHARVQDFKTVDGSKVMLVDELQSDWHREGRKKGYGKPALTEQDLKDRNYEFFEAPGPHGGTVWRYERPMEGNRNEPWQSAAYYDRESAVRNAIEAINENRVPDAPFKGGAWMELGMKAMLRDAVEKGMDGLAWTTGKTQQDRWSLTRHFPELGWKQADIVGRTDGSITPGVRISTQGAVMHAGTGNYEGKVIAIDKLEDYVGQAAADHIRGQIQLAKARDTALNAAVKNLKIGSEEYQAAAQAVGLMPVGATSGMMRDVKSGGEWAENQYDKQMVAFMKKYVEKWGGKVEKIKIPQSKQQLKNIDRNNAGHLAAGGSPENVLSKDDHEVWSVKITPAMRESIKTKGQPLWGLGAIPFAGPMLSREFNKAQPQTDKDRR